MSDGFQYFDIIFFALIAVFVILRLRSALGRRTGQNRQRPNDVFSRSTEPDSQNNNKVIHLPVNDEVAQDEAFEKELSDISDDQQESQKSSVDVMKDSLSRIRLADPNFSPRTFLVGAKGAFEMIVEAFAAGDTASLRPLLGDDVYDEFAEAIRARIASKEITETTIVSIDSTDIVSANLEGSTAQVTIQFVSQQMSVTRDEEGSMLEGQSGSVVRVIDLWTFARNTRSLDPNWAVVETRAPD